MAHAAVAAAFEHAAEADQVRVDVGLRVVDRVAHAGLGGEMDHGLEALAAEKRLHRPGVGDVRFDELESRFARRARKPRLLQSHIVVVVQIVEAGDALAALKQPQCQGGADEAGGAGDEDVHRRAAIVAPCSILLRR